MTGGPQDVPAGAVAEVVHGDDHLEPYTASCERDFVAVSAIFDEFIAEFNEFTVEFVIFGVGKARQYWKWSFNVESGVGLAEDISVCLMSNSDPRVEGYANTSLTISNFAIKKDEIAAVIAKFAVGRVFFAADSPVLQTHGLTGQQSLPVPSGVVPERGGVVVNSGENQIVPGVHGTGQPGPDMGQPVLGLPGQIQAVASTAFDQDIDGQISLNKDLPSVLVLPERGGAKAFDAIVTPGMEIVDPLSLAKNPGSKIMQKVENSSQIVKPLFFGFSHSLCKVLRFLEISSQIVQGVWKNSENKESEGFSDFFSLTRNVKMLISKKIVYYFASWILHDFKKRKKVKIKIFYQ